MSRFNKPYTVKYDLEDGSDWIEVKSRLSYGEDQRLTGAGITTVRAQEKKVEGDPTEVGFDLERYQIDRLFIYLTDWSFKDDNGKVVKISRASISNLDVDAAIEINAILDKHIEEVSTLKN